jgi:mono/diheme cytochrome c family protein
MTQELNVNMQVTAVAYDGAGKLYAFSREPAWLLVYGAPTEPDGFALQLGVKLSRSSARDTGHELFHVDVGTGLSCASCHGEALDDGHVWTFQDVGPRRTQSLRGGVLATLPLHWAGDLQGFGDLVSEVMTRRMGGPVLAADQTDALAHWLDKQPALKLDASPALADTVSVASGRLLFESDADCASCHLGPALTNNETMDVGSGGLFQVPSLRGLALHAPFMHDGCAPTLAERFDPACGGDKHGRTAQLSEGQMRDLIAYLETL